jgi:oxygen-dependent protoporphyrinogen oxidase
VNTVLIVGGGIAGLSTAFELRRRGVPFLLIERGARAGGVVLSEQVDGFTIDAGPDSLLVQKPAGIQLCEELGLGDRLVPTRPPRLAFVQRGGQLYALPAGSVLGIPTRWEPFIRTRLFSLRGKLRMAAELAIPKRQDEEDESIGSFMQRRFGEEAKEYLAEPLLAGIHAGDVDRLSLPALFPRFRAVERAHGSLLRGFRREQQHRRPVPQETERSAPRSRDTGSAFRSLPGGLSEMIDALVATLAPDSIRLNTAVRRVSSDPVAAEPASRPYRVETTTGESIAASAVVLATPSFVTAQAIRSLDATLADLCDEIQYSSTATIALAFRRDAVGHPLNGSGFVVPRKERTGILAASWLSSKWPHRAPDDFVLMRTFVGGTRDPQTFDRSDDELVAVSLKALRPLLGIAGQPLFTRVHRWERANAQHEVGHLARLARIDRAVGRHPGLFVTGSGFRGVGIPDCIADGRATAAKVADWLGAQGQNRK